MKNYNYKMPNSQTFEKNQNYQCRASKQSDASLTKFKASAATHAPKECLMCLYSFGQG